MTGKRFTSDKIWQYHNWGSYEIFILEMDLKNLNSYIFYLWSKSVDSSQILLNSDREDYDRINEFLSLFIVPLLRLRRMSTLGPALGKHWAKHRWEFLYMSIYTIPPATKFIIIASRTWDEPASQLCFHLYIPLLRLGKILVLDTHIYINVPPYMEHDFNFLFACRNFYF